MALTNLLILRACEEIGLNMQSANIRSLSWRKPGPIPPPLGIFEAIAIFASEDGFVPRNNRPQLSLGKRTNTDFRKFLDTSVPSI